MGDRSTGAPGEDFGWKSLVELDPKDVSRKSLATYDMKSSKYVLKILNTTYDIVLGDKSIKVAEGKEGLLPKFSVDFNIMILDYLVNSREIPLSSKLVAGAQLKTGEFFFRGTHGLELDSLIEKFGSDPNGFKEAGILLEGKVMDLGDVSLQLQVLPRVPTTYVLWVADEEFSARISVLFDSTAESHMHLDTLRTAVITANKSLLFAKQHP